MLTVRRSAERGYADHGWLQTKSRRAYVHAARGEIEVNATRLLTGDAVKLEDADSIRLTNGHEAEILAFDFAMNDS